MLWKKWKINAIVNGYKFYKNIWLGIIILFFLVLNVCQVGDGRVVKDRKIADRQLLVKGFDIKMVKSPYNWVIFRWLSLR